MTLSIVHQNLITFHLDFLQALKNKFLSQKHMKSLQTLFSFLFYTDKWNNITNSFIPVKYNPLAFFICDYDILPLFICDLHLIECKLWSNLFRANYHLWINWEASFIATEFQVVLLIVRNNCIFLLLLEIVNSHHERMLRHLILSFDLGTPHWN